MPALLRADDKLEVNQSLTSSYRSENGNGEAGDDDFALILSRTTLSASTQRLFVQLRADAVAFFSLPAPVSPGPNTIGNTRLATNEDDVFIERMTLRYTVDDWVLSGGDFFRQMGKGLILSIRKQDEAAVDLSIQGGQLEYGGESIEAYVFAGRVNPANFDSVSLLTLEDTDDVLVGGSVALVAWPIKVALLALHSLPTQQVLDEQSEINTFGITLDAPALLDWMAIGVEFDAQHRRIAWRECEPFTDDCAGFAAYAHVDLFIDDVSILLEALWLDHFEQRGSANSALSKSFEYNLVPTLQRIDQEVLDQRDVLSGRVRVQSPLFVDALQGAAEFVYREENRAAFVPTHIFHGLGSLQWDYDGGLSRLGLSGGYRQEMQYAVLAEQGLLEQTHEVKSMVHVELDWVQRLSDEFSLHSQLRHESRTLEEIAYQRGDLILGVEWSRVGALAFDFGYDNQVQKEGVRHYFLSGIVSAELGKVATLRMLAGTQRGGIRCVAGVCRNYPAFAGAEAQLVARF